jgi:radical SAM superfamily enzyme YgiQ (UPF0313 family)
MINISNSKKDERYRGFEQGPIRPPSEAHSLLIRVTRNCPWNHCTFCPVYKGTEYSRRSLDHIIMDIKQVSKHIKNLQELISKDNRIYHNKLDNIINNLDNSEKNAFYASYYWFKSGMKSIFLQDSNSLIIKSKDLIKILKQLRIQFPWVERITSYARSSTINKIGIKDLKAIGEAGLNRIHIGLESGSDEVLKLMKKGATKEIHIKAGINVKQAGIELSEYIMPGLGGRKFSKNHALESADAISKINPDFIRLRQLSIPEIIPLYDLFKDGLFKKCSDTMIVKELLIFIEKLEGISSVLKSDHILNLFSNLEGKFPEDKEKMMVILHDFLNLKPKQKRMYQLGRRLGIYSQLDDMNIPYLSMRVKKYYNDLGVNSRNIDNITDNLMKRFI